MQNLSIRHVSSLPLFSIRHRSKARRIFSLSSGKEVNASLLTKIFKMDRYTLWMDGYVVVASTNDIRFDDIYESQKKERKAGHFHKSVIIISERSDDFWTNEREEKKKKKEKHRDLRWNKIWLRFANETFASAMIQSNFIRDEKFAYRRSLKKMSKYAYVEFSVPWFVCETSKKYPNHSRGRSLVDGRARARARLWRNYWRK